MDALMFLLKLAYDSRYRLPILLTVGFMVLDIRMQLEISIHTRRIQRGRRPANPPTEEEAEAQVAHDNAVSEGSTDSWMTYDEFDTINEFSDDDSQNENLLVVNIED